MDSGAVPACVPAWVRRYVDAWEVFRCRSVLQTHDGIDTAAATATPLAQSHLRHHYYSNIPTVVLIPPLPHLHNSPRLSIALLLLRLPLSRLLFILFPPSLHNDFSK